MEIDRSEGQRNDEGMDGPWMSGTVVAEGGLIVDRAGPRLGGCMDDTHVAHLPREVAGIHV